MNCGHTVLIQNWRQNYIWQTAECKKNKNPMDNYCLPSSQIKTRTSPCPSGAEFHYPNGLSTCSARGSGDMSVSDSCRLMTEFLSSFPACVFVCVHACVCVQLLLPSSAGSMTSSRTTTPATIRRRPSRRPRGARRNTTAEGCWGARWARLLSMNAEWFSQSQSMNFLHSKKPARYPSPRSPNTSEAASTWITVGQLYSGHFGTPCALSHWNISKCCFLPMMRTCNVFVFMSHHAAEALSPQVNNKMNII